MSSRYVVYRADVDPHVSPGSPVRTRPVLTERFGCTYLTESVLSVEPGTTPPYASGDHEELLFVLNGHGRLLHNGTAQEFGPESGVYIGPGETYQLEITDSVEAEIVRVRVIAPAGSEVTTGERRTISLLDAQEIGHATAGREYRILADPSTGFRSGTHFVGDVPTGEPAPMHYHLYNEVIYVMQGTGILHIEGERNPIYPGACIHLPARTLHQVENTGEIPIREVAVFVPAGSPAAAYLPDGTSAYPGQPDDLQGGVDSH
ncbi:cupin domain-containing protein [Streptomyces sp. ISID311]|uniref:cupin domain-containing protein n=1 Tax=Streptomyces sp. ISID311 TaxID=2601673 RepID=UPI0011BD4266|nr:cupin domain-containing protein [Streptomyces sp. ISID311]TXC99905.1 cupin domain-containing protein [Streptomyces sp. ISID311]